jgi:hypothetical protein
MSPVFLDAGLVPKGWQPVAASTISMGTASGDEQAISISVCGGDVTGMGICHALGSDTSPIHISTGWDAVSVVG